MEVPTILHTASKVTGVDLGLFHFAIESNGKKIANRRFVKRAEKNLRRKQRQLSRKAKTRLMVAKCHEKAANARANLVNQTMLIKFSYAAVSLQSVYAAYDCRWFLWLCPALYISSRVRFWLPESELNGQLTLRFAQQITGFVNRDIFRLELL